MTTPQTNWDESEKAERLRGFFDGEMPERPGVAMTIGMSDADRKARDLARFEAEFTNLFDDEAAPAAEPTAAEPTPAPGDELIDQDSVLTPNDLAALDAALSELDEPATAPTVEPTPAPDDEPDVVRIDHAPILTPYDKARNAVAEAEVWRDVQTPGTQEYHEAMAELAEAQRKFKLEQERALDDVSRKYRAIDEWRAGEGNETYKASRRKRPKPNARLKDMTPEQRMQHKADMNAKRVWVAKKRKAGWTDARIEAELPGWWARRLAKRACARFRSVS